MGYELNYRAASYLCDSVTAAQTTPVFVQLSDGIGNTVTLSDATHYAAGVIVNVPPLASQATVAYDGVCKVTVDYAAGVGDFLKADATGYGTSATDSSGVSRFARAIALEAASAYGDVIAVRLIDAFGAPTAQ
jgi:hypothetical protein